MKENMQFEKRWANGYWRVFDTQRYNTVELCGTAIECQKLVDQYNAGK